MNKPKITMTFDEIALWNDGIIGELKRLKAEDDLTTYGDSFKLNKNYKKVKPSDIIEVICPDGKVYLRVNMVGVTNQKNQIIRFSFYDVVKKEK